MDRDHNDAIIKTISMTKDNGAQALAKGHGLTILDVTWEDTGRYKGSAVGPNISDMTLQVLDASGRPRCLPVVRKPNFGDITGDVAMENFGLLVGNEKGEPLKKISLREYLGGLRDHLNKPGSWKGERTSLLAEGEDVDVLVSAQACFLPIPGEGKVQFNPVLFNYQSRKGAPAVLAILVTREGTSATIIDNTRDKFEAGGGTWGQRLFHNINGKRHSLTGTRLTDFKEAGGDATTSAEEADKGGTNMVLLIQVPLVQPKPMRGFDDEAFGLESMGGVSRGVLRSANPMKGMTMRAMGVDDAVIGHGIDEGTYTEIDDLAIERDTRFPIRVTVQFYKGTDDGVVTAEDMTCIAAQIEKVYADAKYVGSLVTDLNTGRSTEWDPTGAVKEPGDWWDTFWAKHQEETGQTSEQTLAGLKELLGKDPAAASKEEIIDAIGRLKAKNKPAEVAG